MHPDLRCALRPHLSASFGAARCHAAWLAARVAMGLAGAALLAGCTQAPDALAGCRLPTDGTVLAIGDSLTRGHGAAGQGYAEQLEALLAGPAVVNLGIDGERSAGLRERIDAALAEHRPAVVLITTGGNDFLRRVPEAQTRENLAAIVASVRAAGATPVLFGIPAPSLAAVAGVAGDAAMYGDLAAGGQAHVIAEVVTDVLSQDSLKSDRIHPNREGYALMAQAAVKALDRCR